MKQTVVSYGAVNMENLRQAAARNMKGRNISDVMGIYYMGTKHSLM